MARAIVKKRLIWGSAIAVAMIALIIVLVRLEGPKASPISSRAEAAQQPAPPAESVAQAGESTPAAAESPEVRSVDAIQPKENDHFVISIDEIATVRAYYRADLRAKLAGDVGFIQKNINDQVKKGEKLIEIDVPDLVADVKAKQAMIDQAEREINLAQRQWEIAVAAEKVAHAVIGQREADQRSAEATASYRKLRLDRFTQLAKSGGVVESVVEEEDRDYLAAQAGAESAVEAVNKARADYAQAQVNSQAAKAEIDLKKAMADVAKRDKEMTEAQLSYATIAAPFDGVVIERNTNPGDFVQNATSAQTQPLISIARVDLVTISMEVPDGFAPYVNRGADAEFRVGDLFAHGKVTRYSPSIESKDRTMHVEVDLFNGTSAADYEQFEREHKATWPQERKGADDPFPIRPEFTGKGVEGRRYPLLPGMVGNMRLLLQKFDNVYLIPSEAVFIRSGQTYIAEVVDGKVAIKQVDVQADDSMVSKVLLVNYQSTPNGEQRTFSELTGKERIALRGKELKEGEAVNATLKGWGQ
jgi:multidrug resistance efflux pump